MKDEKYTQKFMIELQEIPGSGRRTVGPEDHNLKSVLQGDANGIY